jgi:peptide/nickel transport system substrate-binding protein
MPVSRIVRVTVTMLALAGVLGAAGTAAGQTAIPSPAAKTTLTVGLTYDLYTSNPLRACGCGAEYEFIGINYDMLLNFDQKTLAPAPGLAEEVPSVENGGASKDGLTWTFHIRRGATWSDGVPVTAHDVAFTYRFVLDNHVGAYDNYLPGHPTFTTPDDYTLIWHATEPTLAPLAPPWIPILPEHVWSRFDGNVKDGRQFENIPAVGTGPFQLVEWKEGQYWRMEANPTYWAGVPSIDEIVFRYYDNQESMALALREGEVDIVSGLIPNLARSLDDYPNIAINQVPARGFLNLAFNFREGGTSTANPVLHDLVIRQAIAHAIDKQALVERVLLGAGDVGSSIVVPTNRWHWEPPPDEIQAFDPELSRQMLDDAGYADTDGNGIRESPPGTDIVLDILTANGVPDAGPSGKLVQAWLNDIGIGVKLRPSSDGLMNQAWTAGTFDAYMWGWNPDPDPNFILSVFTTDQCGSWSDGCYSDARYDALFTEQTRARTEGSREVLVDDLQRFVYEQVPEVVLYYAGDFQAYRTDSFTGWIPTPEPEGYYVFGNVPYGYLHLVPVTAGEDAASDLRIVPLWIWGLGVLGVVALVMVSGRIRRRREALVI